MSEYWVYVNHVRKRFVVHKAPCAAIKMHGGRATNQYWWKGPFLSHPEAWQYASSEAARSHKTPWDHDSCTR